jgi:hypothetical protein
MQTYFIIIKELPGLVQIDPNDRHNSTAIKIRSMNKYF